MLEVQCCLKCSPPISGIEIGEKKWIKKWTTDTWMGGQQMPDMVYLISVVVSHSNNEGAQHHRMRPALPEKETHRFALRASAATLIMELFER
ncbi:hypothetical protein AB6A40_002116 [Gnathostoma spinigerum]|uniref:Uncharacterized protein n=1 Tax=Gnathostoma spinigerum TaxID=75299 RepID=A0ABD6EFF6_9BILA